MGRIYFPSIDIGLDQLAFANGISWSENLPLLSQGLKRKQIFLVTPLSPLLLESIVEAAAETSSWAPELRHLD